MTLGCPWRGASVLSEGMVGEEGTRSPRVLPNLGPTHCQGQYPGPKPPLAQVKPGADLRRGLCHSISPSSGRILGDVAERERPCSDAGLWAGTVMNDSERCLHISALLTLSYSLQRWLPYREVCDGPSG